MFKSTFIGLGIWGCGVLLYLFRMLTILMERADDFKIYSIEQIWGLEWIDSLPWYFLQRIAEFIATTSFYIISFVIGLIFVVFGMFRK